MQMKLLHSRLFLFVSCMIALFATLTGCATEPTSPTVLYQCPKVPADFPKAPEATPLFDQLTTSSTTSRPQKATPQH